MGRPRRVGTRDGDGTARAHLAHLARLDGLRALAALMIVVSHTWLYAAPDGRPVPVGRVGGLLLRQMPLGVTLFFALSGYLLYRPWAAAVLDGRARPNVARYARHRVARIVPAYLVVLVLVGVVLDVASLRTASGRLATGSLVGHPVTFTLDLLGVQGYWPRTLLTGIGPAWSLTTEVAFYLLLPFLGLLALACARGRRGASQPSRLAAPRILRRRVVAALVPVACMVVLGLIGKLLAAVVLGPGSGLAPGYDADWASVIDRSLLGNAELFAPGMLLAVLSVELAAGRWRLPRWWRPAAFTAGLGLAAGTAALLPDSVGQGHRLAAYPYASLMAVPCGLLLALVVLPGSSEQPPWLHRVFSLRPVVAVGLVSYSLFLWNEPLAHWLSARGLTRSGSAGLLWNLALVTGVALACSTATYLAVERPALRRRDRAMVVEGTVRAGV